METCYQLLLNLLMREYINWYYFEIQPRYHDSLLTYMQSCNSEHFVRFDLKKTGRMIYIPLQYRSLTGMHIFGTNTAVCTQEEKELSPIDYKDAILMIVQDISQGHTKDKLETAVQNIISEYQQKQEACLEHIVSKEDIKKWSGGVAERYTPVKTLFSEYSSTEDLQDFKNLLCRYIEKSGLSQEEGATEWVKQYCEIVAEKCLQLYAHENIAISASLYDIALSVDNDSKPDDIAFLDGTPSVHRRFKETDFNEEKLKNFVRVRLLNHHLYPLIRAIGVLSLATERQLLEAITDALRAVQAPYKKDLDLFGVVRTHVTSYTPELLSIPTQFKARQVHIYNSILDKAYYSYDLMKPKPGEVVHKRYFKDGDGIIEIGIRGFNIDTDLEILHEWVNLEYAKQFWEMDGPIEDLEEAYIKHLGVDYSHPYIGTLDGEPIFTLELYWAVKDEVGKYYPFHPGDYGFHMLIAPAKRRIPNFSFHALTMCMEHFFSFNEVHRMIGEASAAHMGTHNLITKVGCEFDKALVLPYKTSNLTFLTREMYYDTVKDVLEYSSLEPIINVI